MGQAGRAIRRRAAAAAGPAPLAALAGFLAPVVLVGGLAVLPGSLRADGGGPPAVSQADRDLVASAATDRTNGDPRVRAAAVRVLDACLHAAGDAYGLRPATGCISSVRSVCEDATPDAGSTSGMIVCLSRELAAWDAILNRDYAQVRAQAMQDRASVATARAWIVYRDRHCDQVQQTQGAGSLAPVVRTVCLIRLTAARLDDLRVLRALRE